MTRSVLKADVLKSLALAAVVAMAWPHTGHAQNMQTTAAAVVDAMKDLPTIISGIAYTFGGILVLGGANKLKQHAENPSQTPMSHGVVRIGVGRDAADTAFATFFGSLESKPKTVWVNALPNANDAIEDRAVSLSAT